jgi:hypothetical protein
MLVYAQASTADAASSAFSNWAAIFVAGDNRAHSGNPFEVFDNARRDLAQSFEKAGFQRENVAQFSVQPEHYPNQGVLKTKLDVVGPELERLAARAKDGCLVYFTSHGSPQAIALGEGYLTPAILAEVLKETCGTRPTVVVISACFSGVFVPTLAGPNRMIMTAARPDRTSFGCGEADRYTFFDACVLQSLPHVHDFMALPGAVRACVSEREQVIGALPSEPQTMIGGALRPMLPLYTFSGP